MEPSVRRVLPAPPEPSSESPAPGRPGALWLALHLPWLAVEAVRDGGGRPVAVSEESRQGWMVHRASAGASRQGVCPGMTLSAAHVLCPDLATRRRSPRRENRRLEALGVRMLSFSPVVSVQPPDIVLMEIRGSLDLFGGLDRLKTLIRRQLDAAGHVGRMAGAPVPAAARCLARWGREEVVREKTALRSALGAMPVGLLSLEPGTVKRLERAGIRILRDLWRLPVDGLARRFGAALLQELDRLRGASPDPQPLLEPPAHFSATLTLDWATDDLAQIERGVGQLIQQWVAYLHQSARGTNGFTIECLPEYGDDKVCVAVGLRRISRDMAHLRQLAGERLSRVRFNRPVVELRLHSDRICPYPGQNRQLFETREETAAQWQQSEELLAAHLGGQRLESLSMVSEHRPEYAWDRVPRLQSAGRPVAGTQRPLWLLDPPRPLPWASGCRARPEIVKGPERIETGWWDQNGQRRDYYVAADRRGRRMWVFQELRHRQWYLHGLFA